MSQRFTVSKSDGDRRGASDLIQGEVNQLFEGDEPAAAAAAASGGEADGKEAAADADAEEEDVVVVVALKALSNGNLLITGPSAAPSCTPSITS
ncbi:unnamed protein product [Merluccius merluccius]